MPRSKLRVPTPTIETRNVLTFTLTNAQVTEAVLEYLADRVPEARGDAEDVQFAGSTKGGFRMEFVIRGVKRPEPGSADDKDPLTMPLNPMTPPGSSVDVNA